METLAAEQLTVSQAARALNLSVSRIKQLTNSGELRCQRSPLGRLISRAALEDFAHGRNVTLRSVMDTPKDPFTVDNLSDQDLATWARARVAADGKELVSLGVRLGLFEAGRQFYPALDIEAGGLSLIDPMTLEGFTLAATTSLLSVDADGKAHEHHADA